MLSGCRDDYSSVRKEIVASSLFLLNRGSLVGIVFPQPPAATIHFIEFRRCSLWRPAERGPAEPSRGERMRKLVVVALLASSLAAVSACDQQSTPMSPSAAANTALFAKPDGGGNGAPSGPHFNLNL